MDKRRLWQRMGRLSDHVERPRGISHDVDAALDDWDRAVADHLGRLDRGEPSERPDLADFAPDDVDVDEFRRLMVARRRWGDGGMDLAGAAKRLTEREDDSVDVTP